MAHRVYGKNAESLLKGDFRVGDVEVFKPIISETKDFQVFEGLSEEYSFVTLKIAKTADGDNSLVSEINKFVALRDMAYSIEKQEADQGISERERSMYFLLFAIWIGVFSDPNYNEHLASIFDIQGNCLSLRMPLSKMKRDWEIDAQNSAWMIHGILKFYELFEKCIAESDKVFGSFPSFTPEDYLLSVYNHRLICCNISESGGETNASEIIKGAAKYFLDWAVFEDEKEQEYKRLLIDYSENGRPTFAEAKQELSELTDTLWGKEYHYFTFRKYGTSEWKEEGSVFERDGTKVHVF